MNTLDLLKQRFNLDFNQKLPIEIPDYGRDNLAELFNELGFTKGVEVGVCDGVYSATLCKANPNLELWGIDPFIPLKGYLDYTRKETFNGMKVNAFDALAPYMDRYHFVEKTSMEAVKDFEDNSLDFVYIDADHEFQHVVNDISEWIKKIRPGGIIAGHDYARTKGHSKMHVMDAVHGYTRSYSIHPWFVLGRQANDEGLIRDPSRSWMWIK